MRIAVASGKGGTGKTTLSVSLASYLKKKGHSVSLLDCDVEEPNVNLFLQAPIEKNDVITRMVPSVDREKCDGSGKCQEICEFNAIVVVKGKPLVFPELCHACGGCMHACPNNAISEVPVELGTRESGSSDGISYIGGRLKIGEAMSPPLIKAVKDEAMEDEIIILDSPPGTSCPVIESIKGSDFVIMATEPTPFGLNDLKLAVGMVREVGIPFGVFLNRSDIGDSGVVDYCWDEGIPVVASIPNSREVAVKYSKGDFAGFVIENFSHELDRILSFVGIE